MAARGTGGHAGGPYTTGLLFEGADTAKKSAATNNGSSAGGGAATPSKRGGGGGGAAKVQSSDSAVAAQAQTALALRETAGSILYVGTPRGLLHGGERVVAVLIFILTCARYLLPFGGIWFYLTAF